MSLRPSLLARWLSQPTEHLLPRTIKNTHSLASTRGLWTGSRSGPILRSGTRTGRRTMTTTCTLESYQTRALWKTRPHSIQFPKQRQLNRRFNSGSSAGGSGGSQAQTEPASLSQRLRKLSREYGWAALGVYLALSTLDFPFCFVAVRLLGVERIGHYEHVVVESVKGVMESVWPWKESEDGEGESVQEDGQGSQVHADEMNQSEEASIWTQLALAYAIHKSLIFIRVPLTAAVTPQVVKTLRRWGWDIGKRKPKRP